MRKIIIFTSPNSNNEWDTIWNNNNGMSFLGEDQTQREINIGDCSLRSIKTYMDTNYHTHGKWNYEQINKTIKEFENNRNNIRVLIHGGNEDAIEIEADLVIPYGSHRSTLYNECLEFFKDAITIELFNNLYIRIESDYDIFKFSKIMELKFPRKCSCRHPQKYIHERI